MYPLKFKNIYHEKIWGGDEFELFRNNLPKGAVGESWDICCSKEALSVVENGEFKGTNLYEIIEAYGEEILGSMYDRPFPLLIKLINAGKNLSIQVHPDKNEFWYIMHSEPGAYIILGVKKNKRDEFIKHICKKNVSCDDVEKCLNKVPVKPGDFFYVGSGLIHAIGKGILLAEIQDNSNITYRLYDYERGRKLEIPKALAVSDFSKESFKSDTVSFQSDSLILSINNVNGLLESSGSKESFHTITCVLGQGILEYNEGIISVNYGDSILIPASIGEYKVIGEMKLIRVDLNLNK